MLPYGDAIVHTVMANFVRSSMSAMSRSAAVPVIWWLWLWLPISWPSAIAIVHTALLSSVVLLV